MNRGYVKLWRKTVDSGMSAGLLGFWTWCLMRASHKDHKVIVGSQVVPIKPGQFVFGRKAAAKELHVSEQNIRTFMKALKAAHQIATRATNKFTIITIINWDSYQNEQTETNHQSNQQTTSKQPANNQQVTTNKNGKNGKNKEGDSSSLLPGVASGTSGPLAVQSPVVISIPLIPRDGEHHVTQDQFNEWVEVYPGIDVLQELRAAQQWCKANPAKRKTSRGAMKFLVGWLNKAQDRAPRNGPGGNGQGQPRTFFQNKQALKKTKAQLLREARKREEGGSHDDPQRAIDQGRRIAPGDAPGSALPDVEYGTGRIGGGRRPLGGSPGREDDEQAV